jgi:hypothetical protein
MRPHSGTTRKSSPGGRRAGYDDLVENFRAALARCRTLVTRNALDYQRAAVDVIDPWSL